MKKQQPVANIIDTLPCFLVWPVRDLNGGKGGGGGVWAKCYISEM